jgi:adenylosuccinate lyase
MDIPEMFLLAEAILIGLDNVTDGLVVYPARIRSRFLEELPFMVTETVSNDSLEVQFISFNWNQLPFLA